MRVPLKPKFLLNFPFGIFIGSIFTFGLAWVLDSNVGEEIQKNWTYGLSALVTLLGATIALVGVFSSIENQNSIAQDNRNRDLAAAKAVLPLALTKMRRVADQGFEYSFQSDEFLKNVENINTVANDVDLPDNVISIFQNCIRGAPATTGRWISVLIAHYQLARSSLDYSANTLDSLISSDNRAESAARWAIVRALADHLWGFARGELSEAPNNLDLQSISMPILSNHFGTQIGSLAIDRIVQYRNSFNSGDIADLEVKNPFLDLNN